MMVIDFMPKALAKKKFTVACSCTVMAFTAAEAGELAGAKQAGSPVLVRHDNLG
jgi:hypothetical protein